jgi:hypothetical protein
MLSLGLIRAEWAPNFGPPQSAVVKLGGARVIVPCHGLRVFERVARLDENCGADGWAMTPSGTRGVLNDAASIYFLDTNAGRRVCSAVVRRIPDRDGGRRVSDARR